MTYLSPKGALVSLAPRRHSPLELARLARALGLLFDDADRSMLVTLVARQNLMAAALRAQGDAPSPALLALARALGLNPASDAGAHALVETIATLHAPTLATLAAHAQAEPAPPTFRSKAAIKSGTKRSGKSMRRG